MTVVLDAHIEAPVPQESHDFTAFTVFSKNPESHVITAVAEQSYTPAAHLEQDPVLR